MIPLPKEDSELRNPQSVIGRLLVVDDEKIVHTTLKRLLGPGGYEIDSAYSGEEVLSMIGNETTPQSAIRNPQSGYDLMILDIHMPGMDGIEVLREIRRREIDIEVLILTGYDTMESAAQALNYGARGYVMKPIDKVAEFRNRVREALHVGRIARHNKQFYDAIVSGKVDSVSIDGKVYQVPTLREENKEIFQRLMEVIRDSIVFLDFDGNITFANVNFAQMIGESYQDIVGARFESYIAEEDQDKVIEVFTRLSGGQVSISIPARLKTSFGGSLSVIISASPIYFRMEYRGIVTVISDVTEISTVRGKVELLANLVENAQYDMMFIVEAGGRIMECNSLARECFGYSRSEMLALHMKALFRPEGDDEWGRIVDSVERESHWRGDLLAVSKDEKELPVEITVSMPAEETDKGANMICFMRDLTERKQAEDATLQARENAERIARLEKELRSLATLSSLPQTGVTARMYGTVTLIEGFPDTFRNLVDSYENLMDLALDQRAYKVKHDISGRLVSMAETLGFYKAGPRDVVDIHTTALKEKTRKTAAVEKKNAYAGEGWIMALELMGHLLSFYRNRAQGASVPTNPKP